MYKFYNYFLLVIFSVGVSSIGFSQDTTKEVTALNVDLLNIFSQKQTKKYKIRKIAVSGNQYFDETLLTSIANLSVGNEVAIPGGDNFSKAITKLWAQNYFS